MKMQHRYTLLCEPGYLFKPGLHRLILDIWVHNTADLVLCHGIMSEQEYQHFRQQKKIPVYQSVSNCWIGLYPSHESKRYSEVQLCGDLEQYTQREWRGYISVY